MNLFNFTLEKINWHGLRGAVPFLVSALRQGALLMVLGGSLATIVVGLYFTPPLFESKAQLLITNVAKTFLNKETQTTTLALPVFTPEVYEAIFTSDSFVKEALYTTIPEQQMLPPEQGSASIVYRSVKVHAVGDENALVVTFTVRGEEAPAAANVANRLVRQALRWETRHLQASEGCAGTPCPFYAQKSFSVLNTANIPQTRVYPWSELAKIFLITAALIFMLVFLRKVSSPKLETVEELQQVTGLPLLGGFARTNAASHTLPSEGVSYLRTNLLYGTPSTSSHVILVTSAKQGEGKSSVAVSLAENFARNNYHTLLVDADLRNPEIAKAYNLKVERLDHTSLETWLRNPLTAREVVRLPLDDQHHLYAIPSFEFNAQTAGLLSVSFHDCLESWRKEYDVIVIDAAPVLEVTDTFMLAPLATSTLMVVNQQKANSRDLKLGLRLLQRIGVRLAGIVATNVSEEVPYGNGTMNDPHATRPDANTYIPPVTPPWG